MTDAEIFCFMWTKNRNNIKTKPQKNKKAPANKTQVQILIYYFAKSMTAVTV